MPPTESLIVETAERIFADLADPQTILKAGDGAWKAKLWNALQDVGLTLAWTPEALGGSDAALSEGFAVIRAAGRSAIAAPLAETLLAAWLLARAGIAAPSGPMSVAPANPRDRLRLDADGRLTGKLRNTPFARAAEHLAVLADGPSGLAIALARVADCKVTPGENLAGDPSDTVEFAAVSPLRLEKAPAGFSHEALQLMGAAVRAQQIAGALDTMLALAVRYAMERVAFEKLISKFQAVQHNLARLGDEVAAGVAAAVSAADTIAESGLDGEEALLEIAAAKIRCGEAAETATLIAHQVHGAIGYTDEHVLHRFTLRALAWRDDFGNESHWSARLGGFVAEIGADRLWPLLASR